MACLDQIRPVGGGFDQVLTKNRPVGGGLDQVLTQFDQKSTLEGLETAIFDLSKACWRRFLTKLAKNRPFRPVQGLLEAVLTGFRLNWPFWSKLAIFGQIGRFGLNGEV